MREYFNVPGRFGSPKREGAAAGISATPDCTLSERWRFNQPRRVR